MYMFKLQLDFFFTTMSAKDIERQLLKPVTIIML